MVQLRSSPDSGWLQRFKKQHEQYLHQTPTGQKVDIEEILRGQIERWRRDSNTLVDTKRALEDKLTAIRELATVSPKEACVEKEDDERTE